jgi:hypothetical protein
MSSTNSPLAVDLREEDAEKLRQIARRTGQTMEVVAARMVANGLFILESTGEGNCVLVEDRQGTRRPLTPA